MPQVSEVSSGSAKSQFSWPQTECGEQEETPCKSPSSDVRASGKGRKG